MNRLLKICMAALAGGYLFASVPLRAADPYEPSPDNREARARFADGRFGIFLHWGIYSLFGQGEWYLNNAGLDPTEYAKAAGAFYPHRFDARAWVTAFKQAGARYVCLTARHHDGFSMWPSDCSAYSMAATPSGRDIVGELADECHRQGLGFHLYYSLIDWTRTDYPAGWTGRSKGHADEADYDAYLDFMKRQLSELLTRYGRVDCIWLDGMWDHNRDSTAFAWRMEELYSHIHALQPACLIGNNHHVAPLPGEDIQIFERDVPGENKAGFSAGQPVARLPLETCQTMNGSWGYAVADNRYKSTATLIRLLARTAGKGANLLLNVGPQPDGALPEKALARLDSMGRWLARNGEAVYGTEAGPWHAGDSIVTTRRGNRLFLHVLSPHVTDVELPVPFRVRSVRALADGSEPRHTAHNGLLKLYGLEIDSSCPDYVIEIK